MLPALLLAFVAVVAVGCGGPWTVPSPGGPLVTVEVRGGECPAGACETTVVVERDGRVHQAAKPPNELGTVPPADLAALDAAIRATDFDALMSRPFTGECPTAYDGQELIFEFAAPGGMRRISTCEIDVDFGAPLFLAVGVALGPFVPLPLT
jgi:hypothetical protein